MQPKLVHIGLIVMCLVIPLLLAVNPAMCKKETGTATANSINALIAEKPILATHGTIARGMVNNSISNPLVRQKFNGTVIKPVSPPPGPSPDATGADLTIIDVKEYRYQQADGKPDSYTLDFLVKNIGNAKSGESNIAYAKGESCNTGGSTMDVSRPHLTVPPLDVEQSAHVTATITETPGCTDSFISIYVNLQEPGCFGGLDYCIPTKETNYENNFFSGAYYVPDKSLPYSTQAPTNQQIADAIFTKINEIRTKNQKSVLIRNSQLDVVAQGFSDSMAESLTCPSLGAHHDAGGNTWLGDNGRMKTMLNMHFAYPAENVLCPVSTATTNFGCDHVPTTVGNTADGIATYTVLSWVEHDSCASDGHKKALLSDPSSYGGTYLPTDVGIGVAKGSDGLYYITADFAHKN